MNQTAEASKLPRLMEFSHGSPGCPDYAPDPYCLCINGTDEVIAFMNEGLLNEGLLPEREMIAVGERMAACWNACLELANPHSIRKAVFAMRAVLMFHQGGPWDQKKWKEIAGDTPATTKGVCDLIRACLDPILIAEDTTA